MSNKETQCRKLYNKDVKFNKDKKLAYLFGSEIFVKKICDYLNDLGLISIELKNQGFQNNVLGYIAWGTSGIYPILLDLGSPDKTDTDKWKDLIKSVNIYYYFLNKKDYNNIIETIYNFQGWLKYCPKIVLDTMLLYLKLGKVPDYTIWGLWSLVDYTDKTKEKFFGKRTDKQLEDDTENIKNKLNKSILTLQEQQLRSLYFDKYLSLNNKVESTTLDIEVYDDINKMNTSFKKFLNYCKEERGDNIDNLSDIIKDFETLYNNYESKYNSASKSTSRSASRSASKSASKSAANMFRFIMNGGSKTIRKHKRKNSTKKKK